MTETQVYELMKQQSGGALPTDRFGFIRRDGDEGAAAGSVRAKFQKVHCGRDAMGMD